ncbi:MAG: ATP synthase F0 subunit B [Deltaproteobacteria bacterium]|nr:ATP synthase F0 subunit B [Deltaproteobacteria bacterium]
MSVDVTFLALLVFFLLTLAGLSQLLFKPMMKVFDEREKRIGGAAAETASLQDSSSEKVEKANKAMADAQAKAREVLITLREEGAAAQKEIIEKARSEAQAKLEVARKELAKTAADASKSLDDESKKLADDIVQKVLGRAA